MPFSDKDLKHLKREVNHDSDMTELWWKTDNLKALIARLEAAERYLNSVTNCDGTGCANEFHSAWRKAKGK